VTIDEMFAEMDLYGFEDFDDDAKLILINEAYFDIATREAWPFMEDLIIITQTPGDDTLNVPTNFQAVLSLTDTANNIVLVPERNDVIEKNFRLGLDSGNPTKYYFIGDTVYLYPPDSTGSVYRLYYVKAPAALNAASLPTDILIPARHHSIIVYGALVKAFLVNDDPQAAVFQNMFESRYQQMRADVWMRQYDRTERVHVITDSDNYAY
tara:strand:- start:291 stop:920 length:630 start_codon:yes stop_codon:yes gene_type:complete